MARQQQGNPYGPAMSGIQLGPLAPGGGKLTQPRAVSLGDESYYTRALLALAGKGFDAADKAGYVDNSIRYIDNKFDKYVPFYEPMDDKEGKPQTDTPFFLNPKGGSFWNGSSSAGGEQQTVAQAEAPQLQMAAQQAMANAEDPRTTQLKLAYATGTPKEKAAIIRMAKEDEEKKKRAMMSSAFYNV